MAALPESGCLHTTLQVMNDTGTKKRIVISKVVKVKRRPVEREFALGDANNMLMFFLSKKKGWCSANIKTKDGRIRVIHRMIPVGGRLEEYDRTKDGDPRYTFAYLLPKTDGSLDFLYFMPFPNESNLSPPITTPDVPPQVPVSTDQRLALPVPVVHSSPPNPTDLCQTGGAYGQQLPTSTLPQGPNWDGQNPDNQPASVGPQWTVQHPEIYHKPEWYIGNPYRLTEINRVKRLSGETSRNPPSTPSTGSSVGMKDVKRE
jgi:hypothetical protein